VRRRSRLKNISQSILHAYLIPSSPHQDLCGRKGRAWLSEQILPADERLAVERHLREFDRPISKSSNAILPNRRSPMKEQGA
jgi:hypothetical protein